MSACVEGREGTDKRTRTWNWILSGVLASPKYATWFLLLTVKDFQLPVHIGIFSPYRDPIEAPKDCTVDVGSKISGLVGGAEGS